MSISGKERNEKTEAGKTPAAKRKGFYAVLYSCVGVILAMAVVIGYRNFTSDTKLPIADPDPFAVLPQDDLPVGNNDEKPGQFGYLTPEDRAIVGEIGEPILESRPNANGSDAAAATPKATGTVAPSDVPPAVQDDEVIETSGVAVGLADDALHLTMPVPETAEENDISDEPVNHDAPVLPSFTAFAEGDRMAWPVLGDIVMEYSMDHVVYDKTLDQYRTNDSLCIAAPAGTEVRAAAEGYVAEVLTTRENGKTVVVDHGNGWRTTYSQLQDNVPVSVGSVVAKGQIIGGVGLPSIYSVLLGAHLEFSVLQSGAATNPKDVLVME